jgi:hypothetical protein
MYPITETDNPNPVERFQEVARIIVRGFLRIKQPEYFQPSIDSNNPDNLDRELPLSVSERLDNA